MSPALPGPASPGGPGEPRPGGGTMGPTPARVLLVWALAGLVLGRVLRPLAEQLSGTAPVITWGQPLALLAVVAVIGAAARATHRVVQVERAPLEPHRAVNRLLLARSCALVGALVGGGYLGYALAWLGSASVLADQRVVRSLLCAALCAVVVVVALLLERACRVREPDADS